MEHKCCKFGVLSFGLALGIVSALYTFLIGLSAMLFNWGVPMIALMGTVYIGYKATLIGSLVGAIWSFVHGFIAGIIFAAIYNCCIKRCHTKCCGLREVPVVPVTPTPPLPGSKL